MSQGQMGICPMERVGIVQSKKENDLWQTSKCPRMDQVMSQY